MHSNNLLNLERQATHLCVEDAFRDDEIICLICGRGGMKTLARHLNFIHNLKPGAYRKLFGIRGSKALTARTYGQLRRDFVKQKSSADFLPKARAAKTAKLTAKDTAPAAQAPGKEKRPYRRRRIFPDAPADFESWPPFATPALKSAPVSKSQQAAKGEIWL